MSAAPPFEGLTPDIMLDAVAEVGFVPDGRFLALNSYENRVYQIGLEDTAPLVAKFYRPGRWSDAAILEEHAFVEALAAREIAAVAPLRHGGRTLHEHRGFRFAIFPRRGGHAPELEDPDTRAWIGRFLGRIHALGAVSSFAHRPHVGLEDAVDDRDWLLAEGWLPDYLLPAYESLTDDLFTAMAAAFERVPDIARLRLHGDCHPGNILWTEDGPHFVDFDDAATGPAIQDLWMLLSGDRAERSLQMSDIVEGYEEFHDFDRRELHILEALRTRRVVRYAAWIARRWHDPAFPMAFPWFAEPRFWEEHLLALREQASAMQEPALSI